MTGSSRKLVLQQNSRSREIERIALRLRKKDVNTLNHQIVQARLDSVNLIWDEARHVNLDILRKKDNDALKYVSEEIFFQMKRVYETAHDEIVSLLNSFLTSLINSNPSPNPPIDSNAHEPTAKLP